MSNAYFLLASLLFSKAFCPQKRSLREKMSSSGESCFRKDMSFGRGAGGIFFSGGGARTILVAYLSRALEGRKFNRKLAGYLSTCHDVTNRLHHIDSDMITN